MRILRCVPLVLVLWSFGCSAAPRGADPLPSWHDGPRKTAILAFVERVTDPESPDLVAESERIATFDNDGTLWAEQPAYVQLLFAIDRARAMAPDHPEWRDEEPFRSAVAGDLRGVAASGKEGLAKLVAATHSGMTVEEFETIVRAWLRDARHPTTGRPYTEMVYQPMLELLEYLRGRGFRTFIVSGGGVDFLRAFAESTYGVPPERTIGSRGAYAYEVRDGQPVVMKLPELAFVDDGPGKPVGIAQSIGRRPVIAVGNSDGDFEMLAYATSGTGPRLGILVHHTDAEREWAYDRHSSIGRLDKALDEAPRSGWLVVDMREDWRRVFPERSTQRP
jgi:phosphoserine phosphatase